MTQATATTTAPTGQPSERLRQSAHDNDVALVFNRPGKPTDNPFIESFNGSFREECLNANWFLSLDDAVRKIEI